MQEASGRYSVLAEIRIPDPKLSEKGTLAGFHLLRIEFGFVTEATQMQAAVNHDMRPVRLELFVLFLGFPGNYCRTDRDVAELLRMRLSSWHLARWESQYVGRSLLVTVALIQHGRFQLVDDSNDEFAIDANQSTADASLDKFASGCAKLVRTILNGKLELALSQDFSLGSLLLSARPYAVTIFCTSG